MSMVIRTDAVIIFPVMGRFKTAIYRPGIDQRTLLHIVGKKDTIEFRVVPPFIAVRPENNRRMVFRDHHHFFQQLCARWRIVMTMPSAKLIHHIQPQRITYFQKMVVGWVMCHSDGIHIHFLHQLHVMDTDFFARCTPGFWMKRMSVDTFKFYFHPVDIDPIPFFYFDRSEPKFL